MARQEDGRNEKLALFQHYPAKPHMEEFSAAFVSLTCDVLGFHSIRIRNWKCGGTTPEVPLGLLSFTVLTLFLTVLSACPGWGGLLGSLICLTGPPCPPAPCRSAPSLFSLSGGLKPFGSLSHPSLFSPLCSHSCSPSAGNRKEDPATWVALWWFRSATYLLAQTRATVGTFATSTRSTPLPPNSKTSPFPNCEGPSWGYSLQGIWCTKMYHP